MPLLYVGLLAIFCVCEQVSSHSPITVTNVSSLIHWSCELQQINTEKIIDNYQEILMQMKKSSYEIVQLESRMNISLKSTFRYLLDYVEVDFSIEILRTQLEYAIIRIDEIFKNSMDHEFSGVHGNDQLNTFTYTVLHENENIQGLLDDLHNTFMPGGAIDPFLTITRRAANRGFLSTVLDSIMKQTSLYHCSRDVSAQQRIYYIFMELIISEMKGLAILTHIYTRKWLLDGDFSDTPYTYMTELATSKNAFEYWIIQYYDLFRDVIEYFPDRFRPCHDNNNYKRDVDYIELINFSRSQILNVYIPNYHRCLSCPTESDLVKMSQSVQATIHNCNEISSTAMTCLPNNGSTRDYLWWKIENGTYYGHNATCDTPSFISAGIVPPSLYTMTITPCKLCVCSVDQNRLNDTDSYKVWRISVADQITDIWNNKVVTGVRFVTRNNTIYLQIQEGEFSSNAGIHSETTWKNLDDSYINRSKIIKQSKLHSIPLSYKRKSILLDHIKVPKNYAVTGVRLQVTADGSGFQLQVHGTKFNFDTGSLTPYNSGWFSNGFELNLNRNESARYITEIELEFPDDPARSEFFQYNDESNKVIKFRHTDIQKDAGQTTIPFLDARPVVTMPSFPLRGVGLFYKGRSGFGGFIAPQIYTIDVSKYMAVRI